MNPTIRPPSAGARMTQAPSVLSAGERAASESVWKKNRFVNRRIAASSSHAPSELRPPMASANSASSGKRGCAEKSRLWLMLAAGSCAFAGREIRHAGDAHDVVEPFELAHVARGDARDDAMRARAEAHFDAPRVDGAAALAHETERLAPFDQRDGALVAGAEPFGEFAHARMARGAAAAQMQQQQILQRRNADPARRLLAEAQELREAEAELRERRVAIVVEHGAVRGEAGNYTTM